MAGSYYIRQTALLALILLLGLGSIASAQGPIEWRTLTSFKDVRRMAVIDDSLYVATSGGLLVISNPNQPGETFIHTDGLGTSDIHDVIEGGSGYRWLAGYGRLIRFDATASRVFLFRDQDGNYIPLYSLADDGDNLWIGSAIGLVYFSKTIDGGQIQDSYSLFGNLNPSPHVNDISHANDTIWIATSAGLACAPTSDPVLLKSPLTWTVFDVGRYPELGSDTIRAVTRYHDDIYVATSQGAFRFNPTPAGSSFVSLTMAQDDVVRNLDVERDTLFVYSDQGLGVVTAGGDDSLTTFGLPPGGAITGTVYAGDRWVAAPDSGLYRWTSDRYTLYPYTAAPGNDVRTLAVDPEGVLTAGFGDRIYSQFIDSTWVNRGFNSRDGTMGLLVDRNGTTWAASWGEGLWELLPDTSINFDEQNSTCTGILGSPSYVVVRGIATDGAYLYALLDETANGSVVAVAPLDDFNTPSAWTAFGSSDGFLTVLTSSIAYGSGQLAVGTTGDGVYLADFYSDPWDGTAPTVRHYTTADVARLRSNTVRTVAYPPRGGVWVGTNLGISRWDPGIDRFVDVDLPAGVGTDISAIAFDGRSNVWIGTRGGLVRLDATSGAAAIYTTENSGLVSDNIRDVFVDRPRGNIFIATDGGISIIDTRIDTYTTEADSILPVPNPFVIESSADRLSFNYDGPAWVTLYTIAGEKVADFSVNETWNGRNARGASVASGVYLYVVTHGGEMLARGKVLVIRK